MENSLTLPSRPAHIWMFPSCRCTRPCRIYSPPFFICRPHTSLLLTFIKYLGISTVFLNIYFYLRIAPQKWSYLLLFWTWGWRIDFYKTILHVCGPNELFLSRFTRLINLDGIWSNVALKPCTSLEREKLRNTTPGSPHKDKFKLKYQLECRF